MYLEQFLVMLSKLVNFLTRVFIAPSVTKTWTPKSGQVIVANSSFVIDSHYVMKGANYTVYSVSQGHLILDNNLLIPTSPLVLSKFDPIITLGDE